MIDPKKRYVLGLIFREDGQEVLLLRKNRPEWQAGKLNGIGGHIEIGEAPLTAMERESMEEVGRYFEWSSLAYFKTNDWEMFVYTTRVPQTLRGIFGQEDEQTEIVSTDRLPDDVIPNLRYLIPFALNNTYGDWLEISNANSRWKAV